MQTLSIPTSITSRNQLGPGGLFGRPTPAQLLQGATPVSVEQGMSRDGDARHGGRRGSRSHARDATRTATDATTSELLPTNAATRRRRSCSSSSSSSSRSESGDEGEGYLGTVTFFDRKAKMRLGGFGLYSTYKSEAGVSEAIVKIDKHRNIMYKDWLKQTRESLANQQAHPHQQAHAP